jgi:fused signal recognition particle receptor
MQTDILFSIIALTIIIFVITFDLIRAKQGRSKPNKVDQKSHTSASEVNSLKKSQPDTSAKQAASTSTTQETPKNLLGRMKKGLGRTRGQLTDGLSQIFLGKKKIDEALLEDIETQLLTADIGIEATAQIIQSITEKSERNELKDAAGVYTLLKQQLSDLLNASQAPLDIDSQQQPFVILVVGVNGVGKTTTIGKMAKRFQNQGKSVMLAAGDTFRAAAVEQLQVWGERNNVPVVAQHTGADSASVIFDAIESAKAKKIDVVIADTAGRLQNKDNLMNELEKIVRVMRKVDDSAPHEVMLVLDACTGQNALTQAQVFQQAVGVTGISLTKLDGTAKGGVIFAIAKQLNLPIRFIGVGEQIDDLRPFKADEFVAALFDES